MLALSPQGLAADIAKEGRTRIAHALLRRTEAERPDVVLYCLDALKRLQAMNREEVEGLALEIAILGTKGLDINDSAQKYTLRRLPGNYSGLQLLSLMYVAFKQVRPEADINADFSREYAKAMELFGDDDG